MRGRMRILRKSIQAKKNGNNLLAVGIQVVRFLVVPQVVHPHMWPLLMIGKLGGGKFFCVF